MNLLNFHELCSRPSPSPALHPPQISSTSAHGKSLKDRQQISSLHQLISSELRALLAVAPVPSFQPTSRRFHRIRFIPTDSPHLITTANTNLAPNQPPSSLVTSISFRPTLPALVITPKLSFHVAT